MELNNYGALGLPDSTQKTKALTEITFPNQTDSDKNRIKITTINARVAGICAGIMNSCIDIVEVWHFNDIRIAQIECGEEHVIALGTKGKAYWFGRFRLGPLSLVSSGPIPFSHRITLIRSGFGSVAYKDATNEWYV